MIERDEISFYLVNLFRNRWGITNEDNKLIARSPEISDTHTHETYRYRLDIINKVAYKDMYKGNNILSSEEVSFELIVRKKFKKSYREGYLYGK